MNPGQELTIEPQELVAGGAALAKLDGFPIFVTNVYPGDVARVRVTEVKKGFARADLIELVTPSPLRRVSPCPIADDCGGCDWTSLRLDAQLEAKERILRESLRRIGKLASIPPVTLHPSPLNYRLRSRLHTDGVHTGFYAAGTHRVVPLSPECEVVGVLTASQIPSGSSGSGWSGGAPIPRESEGSGWSGGAQKSAVTSEESSHTLRTTHPPGSLALARDLRGDLWEVDGQLIANDGTGDAELTIEADRYQFRLSTGAFFQVNRHLLGTMLDLVRGHAERTRDRRRAIDLYAGVGFFSAPLSDAFERVFAVEGSDVSHHWARVNASGAAKANIEAIHAPVEAWVARMPRAAFVFLDPPRTGAQKNVIDAIAAKASEVICFLACDPVTLARDANRLTASGWRLAALDLLDLFPNTHHLETLARFERVP